LSINPITAGSGWSENGGQEDNHGEETVVESQTSGIRRRWTGKRL